MGWFWTDSTSSSQPVAPHPIPKGGDASPPPGCPMHQPSNSTAPTPAPAPSAVTQPTSPSSACPYVPPESSESPAAPTPTPSYISKLNPLNYMPTSISNTREAKEQSVSLPLEREASTIPRGDLQGATWEYPSPQQMYNALLRKGYTDTPAEHVESMVAVHNFLNEGAWEEIREWERRFAGGLGRGWELCKHGEEGAQRALAIEAMRSARDREQAPEPKLLRFMGRPSEMTPKARMMGFMAWLYPAKFPDNPPFDRHDWFVARQGQDGEAKERRYVIDYYSGPPEPTGEPVFFLDVRPAVDGPVAAAERMVRWGGDVWYRASGGGVREEMARRKNN
ncbi:hypothetical protein MBLNU230_g3334t1 [Neophaeotheca triangularis]